MYAIGNVVDRRTGEQKELIRLENGNLIVRNPRTRSAHPYNDNDYTLQTQSYAPPRAPAAATMPLLPPPQQTLGRSMQQRISPLPAQYQSSGFSVQRSDSQPTPQKAGSRADDIVELPYHQFDFGSSSTAIDVNRMGIREARQGRLKTLGANTCFVIVVVGENSTGDTWQGLAHLGASVIGSEKDAASSLGTLYNQIKDKGCSQPRTYVIGGTPNSLRTGNNILASARRFNIIGAKVNLCNDTDENQWVNVVVDQGRIYCIYSRKHPKSQQSG